MKTKCRCCQWYYEKKDDLCESCKPLVKRFTEEIIEEYGTKRKSTTINRKI